MREIVLDTETTGLSINNGDKIIEIGAVELKNKSLTGNKFQCYINPQREVSDESYKIHGISSGFLKDKSLFIDIADKLLDFIDNDPLIMHNANFDIKFLNYELKLAKKPLIKTNRTIDTLTIARKLFPGSRVNLDALCKRLKISFLPNELDKLLKKNKIDLSKLNACMTTTYLTNNIGRGFHGALKDAVFLAFVYINLVGRQQYEFFLKTNNINHKNNLMDNIITNIIKPTESEKELHNQLLSQIKLTNKI